ncbi:hypothetical protein [Mycobacterium sp.]|uniref:hypothetical protein n=1 Tax=Mycobacterium sp. TaxID=1785 RepID=UPI003A88ADAD
MDVELISSLGTGTISTTDDLLNTSLVEGDNATDAFNTLNTTNDTMQSEIDSAEARITANETNIASNTSAIDTKADTSYVNGAFVPIEHTNSGSSINSILNEDQMNLRVDVSPEGNLDSSDYSKAGIALRLYRDSSARLEILKGYFTTGDITLKDFMPDDVRGLMSKGNVNTLINEAITTTFNAMAQELNLTEEQKARVLAAIPKPTEE